MHWFCIRKSTLSKFVFVEDVNVEDVNFHIILLKEAKWKLLQNCDEHFDISDLKLYHGESWELLIRRWAKLEKDFKMKDGRFDVSKIPDIYDCIKYDLQHNQKTIQYEGAKELFECSKALADIVIPQV